MSLLESERWTDDSSSLHVVPIVLPAQIYALRPLRFLDAVGPQARRLKMTRGAECIVVLEDEFCSFKRYVAGSPSALQSLQDYDRCIASGGGVF